MAKRILENEFIEILAIIQQYPTGVGLDVISQELSSPLHPRTLQRRLSSLIKERRIYSDGNTRSKRYWPNSISDLALEKPSKGASLVLSKEGKELLDKVTKPKEERPHQAYNQDFLEDYIPNKTFYLPEALRKKLHSLGQVDGGNYPAGTFARNVFHRLLIDLAWNSSRLEGNTYSLLETERLLDKGIFAEGKDAKETQMILNHKGAIKFLVDLGPKLQVETYTIFGIHALLSDNLLSDYACGSLRSIPVGIGQSTYTPIQIPQKIIECFNKLIQTAASIKDPLEQAFFLMVHIPYLQPFEDVNKRTSRLAVNIPLIKNNLCPLSFIDVPDKIYISGLFAVYELNRIELLRDVFEWAYERSCFLYSKARSTIGEPDLFRMRYRDPIIKTIHTIVQKGLNKLETIEFIRKQSEEFIPKDDYMRFIEVVERELQALHKGSAIRYNITILEFEKWKPSWK